MRFCAWSALSVGASCNLKVISALSDVPIDVHTGPKVDVIFKIKHTGGEEEVVITGT